MVLHVQFAAPPFNEQKITFSTLGLGSRHKHRLRLIASQATPHGTHWTTLQFWQWHSAQDSPSPKCWRIALSNGAMVCIEKQSGLTPTGQLLIYEMQDSFSTLAYSISSIVRQSTRIIYFALSIIRTSKCSGAPSSIHSMQEIC